MKRCKGCQGVKHLSEFYNDKNSKDGKTYKCKECSKKASNQYAIKHREQKCAYQVEYQKRNYAKHLAKMALYRSRHKGEARAYMQNYRKQNLEKFQEHWASRRAKMSGGSFKEKVDRFTVAERDGWICQLCCQRIDKDCKYINAETGLPNPYYLNIDHIRPLSRGGDHSYENCQATHAICNKKKFISTKKKGNDMSRTIDIPGGTAVLLEGPELSNKQVKNLRRAARSLIPVKAKLDAIGIETENNENLSAKQQKEQEKKSQAAFTVLNDDEIDNLDLFQRACVVVCLESWTLEQPKPGTVEDVDDLHPRALYKVLTEEASKVNLNEDFGMEGAPDPKADTES